MGANIIIPNEISKEYFKVVDFEDANQRDKPKGRFFRSVRLYLTEIMIDICRNWRKFWQKKWRKGAFAFGGIGRIGLIRPIGHQLVDSPTCKLVDSLTC